MEIFYTFLNISMEVGLNIPFVKYLVWRVREEEEEEERQEETTEDERHSHFKAAS